MSKEIKMRLSNVERKDQKRCLCVLDIGPKPSISDFIPNALTKNEIHPCVNGRSLILYKKTSFLSNQESVL